MSAFVLPKYKLAESKVFESSEPKGFRYICYVMRFIDFIPTSRYSSGLFKSIKIKAGREKLKNELDDFYKQVYVANEMDVLLIFHIINHADGLIYLGIEMKPELLYYSIKDSVGHNFQKNIALNRLLFVLGIDGFAVFQESDNAWNKYLIKVLKIRTTIHLPILSN